MIHALIAEDDEDVLELLKTTITAEGYDIDIAHSGAQALQALLEKRYDLVLSDLNLGDTTGINVLKAAIKINPDVKFILLTAFQSIESAIEGIRCGISDYIVKPFDTAELKFRVNLAVSKLEADRKRKEIENRYRILTNISPFGIVVISSEMEIIEANAQVKKWFPDLVVSETPRCMEVLCTPPKETPCNGCPAIKTLSDGANHKHDRTVELNGTAAILRIKTHAIPCEPGQPASTLLMMEKISST